MGILLHFIYWIIENNLNFFTIPQCFSFCCNLIFHSLRDKFSMGYNCVNWNFITFIWFTCAFLFKLKSPLANRQHSSFNSIFFYLKRKINLQKRWFLIQLKILIHLKILMHLKILICLKRWFIVSNFFNWKEFIWKMRFSNLLY